MNARLVIAVTAIGIALASWLSLALYRGRVEPTWAAVDADIARRFPQVPRIGHDELLARLRGSHPPVVLDVREPDEYAVSHLPGARRVEPGASVIDGLASGEDVVVYCAVGERSSALAQRLIQRGFAHVADLEGGIFAWANDGLPLERDGHPALVVHPYDERWGRLLARERWQWRAKP